GPWHTHVSVDDDGEYFARTITKSDRILFVTDAKSFCRISNLGSLSKSLGCGKTSLESQFESMTRQIGYLRSLEDSSRTRRACITYLQRWLIHFYPERMDIVAQAELLAQ